MSARPPPAAGTSGSFGWVKKVLTRQIKLEQRSGQVHVALVERKSTLAAADKPCTPGQPATVAQQRAELGARLVAHELDAPAQLMRHLVFVHEELGRGGWPGVETLPAKVVARALMEAELLSSQEPSPLLTTVIEALQALKYAADCRQERDADLREWAVTDIPDVSEATHEEFEQMQRSWIGTVPDELAAHERGTGGGSSM